MQKDFKRIGEILIERGLITQAQLYDAIREQSVRGGFLGEVMISKGWITEEKLLEALARQFGMQYINLRTQYIDMKLAGEFSSSLIIDHKCFPLLQDADTITVAITNPLDAVAISKIEAEAKPRKVNLVLVNKNDLKDVLENYHRNISQNIKRMLKDKKTET